MDEWTSDYIRCRGKKTLQCGCCFFYVVFLLLLLFRLMDLQQRIRQLNKTDPVHQMERPRRISVMSQTPPTRLTNYVIFVISTARFNIYLMTVVVRVWLGIYDIEIYQRNSMCYLVVACVFCFFVFRSSVGNHSSPHNEHIEQKNQPTTDLLCLFLFGRHVVVAAVRRCPSKRSNAMRLMAICCFLYLFFSSLELYSQFFNVLPISLGRVVFAGNLAHCHIVSHHIEPIAWANLTSEPNARIEETQKKENNKTYR